MIEARVPSALTTGDTILVWWPDWYMRRADVTDVARSGDGWRIGFRFRDGDDAGIAMSIVRSDNELVPVVVKSTRHGTLENPDSPSARSRRKARARRDDADPTAEDEALAQEYLESQRLGD